MPIETNNKTETIKRPEKAVARPAKRPMARWKVVGLSALVVAYGSVVMVAIISNNKQLARQPHGTTSSAGAAVQTVGTSPVPKRTAPQAAASQLEVARTLWNEKLAELPVSPPADMDEWRKIVSEIDFLSSLAADWESKTLLPQDRQALTEFERELSRRQAKLFPALRKRFADFLDQQLFREDVRVRATSGAAQTIVLTSYRYAANATVADTQAAMNEQLSKVRFRRVEYRWASSLPGQYYAMQPPSDTTIAYWDGASMKAIKPR